ncbi:Initiator tRNA phosphoribosyl-transferase [Phaffia rhodozyma]|uniref:Initiator tRNA phosphoribosyl-transferase n=1 Tax=Phaffia rhodozyma TaxID=264483 RepID=A0A0F7SUK7_PHARH|nr:Initiator tRNA phosphoribosyl-transferase [Phaffia rhodozyma]
MEDSFLTQSKAIRKQSNDIYSRLRSIQDDAKFVEEVSLANPSLPLVANLRCGAWYCPPEIAHPSTPAYFKSQDGHEGQWDFSLRRSNLHLLPLISERGGIILVDSTRRGKRLPDALSKTIPQWCATINRALIVRDGPFQAGTSENETEAEDWARRIYVSPRSVSDSEKSRMEALLEGWASKLLASSLELPSLKYPLRPIFVHKPSTLDLYHIPSLPSPSELGFHPVMCLSASEYIEDSTDRRRPGGWEYHQGAGDDHESWGMGMSPSDWWVWRGELLALERDELELEVRRRVQARRAAVTPRTVTESERGMKGGVIVKPTRNLFIGTLSEPASRLPTISIYTSSSPPISDLSPSGSSHSVPSLVINHRPGKDDLQTLFNQAVSFAKPIWADGGEIWLGCENGKDISVGAGIVLLQTFFNDSGELLADGQSSETVSKATIQKRLQWIINAQPGANPTRSTLKTVNAYFMSARFKPT